VRHLTETVSELVLELAQGAEALPDRAESPGLHWQMREAQLAVFDDDFSNFRAASTLEDVADAALAIACTALVLAARARRASGHPEAV
jgi:hypothetical protein